MTDSTAPQPIRSVLLVTNPLSGHGRGLTAAAAAAARFADRGVRVTEVRGGTAEESVRRVREALAAADAPDAVVCAGGDGLVCITLGALAGSAVPLGLVPGGTGNDLARELGVPEHDPIAAADVVLDGRVRRVDLGTVDPGQKHAGIRGEDAGVRGEDAGVRGEDAGVRGEGAGVRGEDAGVRGEDARSIGEDAGIIGEDAGSRGEAGAAGFGGSAPVQPIRFATVVGTGFDARVTLRANRMRYPRGPMRYTLAALAEMASGLAVPYRIELSGVPGQSDGAVVEIEAVMVAVGNTRSYGGGMLICPDAVLDDGLLDVTVVGAMSRVEMIRLLPALAAGKRVDHPALSQYRASTIVATAPGAPATADGEPAGVLPATFRALPGALPVFVP
ncbi:diacylglycerol kinase family protein [Nocardia terpenica]|uniref:diacylglycerol kinase family protein n=1 Tax=Nocardia terpenica TaxID=455432 RepID=UPI0002F24A7F|nr:diacylglycerol kinase family protein [Nocardia terpenica]